MYNRGRDSMEFFMFINSTVHWGGFRALRKSGVDTIDTINLLRIRQERWKLSPKRFATVPLDGP